MATDIASAPADEEHEHTSRWPLLAAVGAGMLYVGIGLAFVGRDLVPGILPLALGGAGAVGFLTGIGGWLVEAFVAPWSDHVADRSDVYVGGMVLFLVSDVATFLAGFVYYAFVRVGAWPPTEVPHLLSSLVLVNTLLLLASSATLHYAHVALETGDRRRFLWLLGVTVGLGAAFLGGQVFEYYEFVVGESFTLSSGVFASAFYGLTGLHGLHVTLGAIMLAITLVRALRGQHTESRDTGVRTVALYWHFVDAVWIVLVAVLYVGATVG